MVDPSVVHLSEEERSSKLARQLGRCADTRVMKPRVTHRGPHERFEQCQGTTLEIVVKCKLPKKLNEAMAKGRKECAALAKKNVVVTTHERVRKDRLNTLECISVNQVNYFNHFIDEFIAHGGSMTPSCKEVSDFFYQVFVPYLFDLYGIDVGTGKVPVPSEPVLLWWTLVVSSFFSFPAGKHGE